MQKTHSWRDELAATLKLAWPLVIAQLAQMSLFTTDVVMMGWLGPDYLASGTLATAFLHPMFVFAMGILFSVSPLVSNAIGAKDEREVRRATRQGLWVALLLGFAMVPVMWQTENVLLLFGQKTLNASLAGSYMLYAAWVFPLSLVFQVMRMVTSAHSHTMVVLVATLTGFMVNAAANYALMFGNWGFPRMELAGAGIATTFANAVMCVVMLAYTLSHRDFRKYHLLVHFWHPDWQKLIEIIRVGLPIGFMLMAEVGVFAGVSVLMGWLGTPELAAHAVALQCAAIAFMVPLGLSQATTIRIGIAYGARDREGVRKAGWVSLFTCMVYMSCTCLIFLSFPKQLIALFLDPDLPENAQSYALAVSYLWVAAWFQLADGAQVIGAAALRGLKDTTMPMWSAIVGYWFIGMPIAYYYGFLKSFGGLGIWFGLAAGLAFVAFLLCSRFALREKLGLLEFHEDKPL